MFGSDIWEKPDILFSLGGRKSSEQSKSKKDSDVHRATPVRRSRRLASEEPEEVPEEFAPCQFLFAEEMAF